MKEAEVPLDFSFVFDLAQPPSLEDELHLEKEIRMIKSSDDIEGIKNYAVDTARQNYQQTIFIAGCLTKIAELQTRIVKVAEMKEQKSPNLLKKLLKLK